MAIFSVSFRDRLTSRLAHTAYLLMRPMTLGVRGVVIDEDDSVLLVRHGYVAGWHFPGGGVELGESCGQALARELDEEARVVLSGPPRLHGVFLNVGVSRRDHVAVYVVRAFSIRGERAPDWEIREAQFFPPRAPAGGNEPGRPRQARRDS